MACAKLLLPAKTQPPLTHGVELVPRPPAGPYAARSGHAPRLPSAAEDAGVLSVRKQREFSAQLFLFTHRQADRRVQTRKTSFNITRNTKNEVDQQRSQVLKPQFGNAMLSVPTLSAHAGDGGGPTMSSLERVSRTIAGSV